MLTFGQGDGGDNKRHTKLQATRLITKISKNGHIRYKRHARDRMKECEWGQKIRRLHYCHKGNYCLKAFSLNGIIEKR